MYKSKKNIKIKFSLIIPIYRKNLITKIFRSINISAKHLLKQLEIIVVDMNPNKNLKNLIKKYKRSGLRIKYVESYGKFPAYARNVGASLAVGKYLIFIDEDMLMNKNFFIILTKVLKETKNLKKTIILPLIIDKKKRIDIYCPKLFLKLPFLKIPLKGKKVENVKLKRRKGEIFISSFIVRKSEFKRFDERFKIMHEDLDLAIRLKKKGYVFLFVPSLIIVHYKEERYSKIEREYFISNEKRAYLFSRNFLLLCWKHYLFVLPFALILFSFSLLKLFIILMDEKKTKYFLPLMKGLRDGLFYFLKKDFRKCY